MKHTATLCKFGFLEFSGLNNSGNIWDNPSTQLNKIYNKGLLILRPFNAEFFNVAHLAVSLIPKLDLEDLCSFCMSCDSSHKLYQSGFTTSNRALKQHRLLGSHGQCQSSQIPAGWVHQHQIFFVHLQNRDQYNDGRDIQQRLFYVTKQELRTCSACLGTILGRTTPQTATTFWDRSSDTTWPLVNLLALSWRHITEPWLVNTKAFSTSSCWASSKALNKEQRKRHGMQTNYNQYYTSLAKITHLLK